MLKLKHDLVGQEVPQTNREVTSTGRVVERPLEVSLRVREDDNRSDRESSEGAPQELRMRTQRAYGVSSEGENADERLRLHRRLEAPSSEFTHRPGSRTYCSDGEKAGSTADQGRGSPSQERGQERQSPEQSGIVVEEPSCGSSSHGFGALGETAAATLPEDPVNHPRHYLSHPSGVECITVAEHFNFNRGNAIKYIWRAGEKGNEIEDLKKAAWYLQREIDRISKQP